MNIQCFIRTKSFFLQVFFFLRFLQRAFDSLSEPFQVMEGVLSRELVVGGSRDKAP